MSALRPPFEQTIASYSRDTDKAHVAAGEKERQAALELFPLERWPSLSLEEYALGQADSVNTFCRWMEFRTPHLGSIKGGAARKLIIYKHKDKPGWYFDSEYKDEQEAWLKVREAFVQAFQKAQEGDWNAIDDLVPLQTGPALRLKTLHLYFPSDILPIYSQQHLRHFLQLFGCPEADDSSYEVVRLNRALLNAVYKRPEFQGWSTNEVGRFLYRWADPREQKRVVKIAPGEDAKYWDDCRRESYICVGWDSVGDLREFESKESFKARFEKEFAETYNHHRSTVTRKANEVWTLQELEPGDIVVANKGTSHILAIGKVVEPGYVWNPDRPEYCHTVKVEWDEAYAKDIPPQKKWALVTVAPVSASLYESIAASGEGEVGANIPTVVPLDSFMNNVGDALQRKGQAILYGPPGTGKTYQARRFAIAWLLQHAGREAEIQSILNDRRKFEAVERSLATAQVSRRVWWVVANPKVWSWDQLFTSKRQTYNYGRIQRNFPHVKAGDLVICYQSTPDKKIVALARVSTDFGAQGDGEPTFEVEPLAKVKDGLTYDQLLEDELLKNSEPMRFRNQGTLFALNEDEADHVLSLLAERDPDIQAVIGNDNSEVGPLTKVTFHPSYSYEDFVEGFRPHDTGGGTLSLRLSDGVFKRICHAALANPKKRYLLLIDEINRANIAKVFGELITLLENDKRNMYVTLPQSKENFCIPPNVYLLGTMNTADRSIKLLDAALRRRFAFIEMMPNAEVLRGAKIGRLALDDFLEKLNQRIARNEGREKQIGHSFLLDKEEPVSNPDEFARRFRQEILPLLQEYCYDDYGALSSYIGDKLVDKEGQNLDHERLTDTDALLTALESEFNQND